MAKNFLMFLCALILFGAAHITCAQNVILQCNACTQTQADTMARNLGIGKHLIGDFTNNILRGYQLTREPNGVGGYDYELDPLSTTTLQQQAFAHYRTLIVTYHSNAIIVMVPTPRPNGYPGGIDLGTGLQWASGTNYRNALSNYIANMQAGSGVDTMWMPGAANVAMLAVQSGVAVSGYSTKLTFKIELKDGSIVSADWDGTALTLTQVLDPFNNTIPIQNQGQNTNYTGLYNIPPAQTAYVTSLINYLNQLGASVTDNRSGGSGHEIAISCGGAKCVITWVF